MRAIVPAILLALAGSAAVAADSPRFIDSDGCRIAYFDHGAGEPVILLHGLSANFNFAFRKTGEALVPERRVIGMDLRGHGESCKPHGIDDYGGHFTKDVLNLMDRLRIARAHIVGHSLGGIVTMDLAANHPERVQSAVSIGNGLFHRRELVVMGWLLHGLRRWNQLKAFLGLADPPDPAFPVNDREAMIAAARSIGEMAVTAEQAAALKVPLLAIRGGPRDDPRNTVERLAAVNPAVRTIRVESEDHLSLIFSERFLQELKAFLQSHPFGA